MLNKLTTRLRTLALPGNMNKTQWLMGAGGLVLTGAIVLSLWRNDQGYVALYGKAEHIPVAQVVEVLGAENIAYRVNPVSGDILVTEKTLSRARMALAAKGISATLPDGYELMDKEEMLGSSQFIQNVRYKRSLEGELARSVMALDAVERARVHLGLSDASSFVLNNRPESSASVLVQLAPGRQLDDAQIAAIIQLVTGSVPGMKPSEVSVVDSSGNLLSEAFAASQGNAMQSRASLDAVQRIRSETTHNIAVLLTPLVGNGNFRISVAPQVDLSHIEETQERLGEQPKIREENLSEENTSRELALGIPGSLSNRPVTPPAEGNAAPNTANPSGPVASRSNAQRSYAFDRDIRHIRHPGWRLEKLQVAVVLNQGAVATQALSPEQLADITKMVEQAAGLNATRGDVLSLSVLAFSDAPSLPDLPAEKWWQDRAIQFWGQNAGLLLLALLVLLFGLRPLVRRFTTVKTLAQPLPTEPLLEAQPPLTLAEGGEDTPPKTLANGPFQQEENLPPMSSGLETKVEFLQTLASNETDRMAEVMKQWISSHERNSEKEQ
ncbi:flagellar M-ring protein FliF [Mangrovibacter plantisponsor]|uniref:Flagellar M-ring protein n=2 Tax=Mangrovibacter plantisponsor TaxID=451513 RepID=A0A317PJA1_9ENTR|nr:flagellar basal-body MS-ring/collar protein FliF [Mangrovibacter plantisponsor]PWW00834.1 flagellar M-ring protein FliF [Mangrovibacter plantisponsor]